MPIEDPEGEFGGFKRKLFYDFIWKAGLINQILTKTDYHKEFPSGTCTNGAFWYFVCQSTKFTPEDIDIEFWEEFPTVKEEILRDTILIGGKLTYVDIYQKATRSQ
jgi:hypothetical protein